MDHVLDIAKSVFAGCIVLAIQAALARTSGAGWPSFWVPRPAGAPRPAPPTTSEEIYRARRESVGAIALTGILFVCGVLLVLVTSLFLDTLVDGQDIALSRLPLVGGVMGDAAWDVLGSGLVFRSTLIATGLCVAALGMARPVIALQHDLGYFEPEPWKVRVYAFPVALFVGFVHAYYLSGQVGYLAAWGVPLGLLVFAVVVVASLAAHEEETRKKREAEK